ncbi:MAG: GNAT family N-acetyltransferase [Candidatus Methanofastidiosia archaeon]
MRKMRFFDIENMKEIIGEAFSREIEKAEINIDEEMKYYKIFYPLTKILPLFGKRYSHVMENYIYEEDGKIIGLLETRKHNLGLTQWYVSTLAVHKDFRGRGIGTRLLNFVFDTYGERGVKKFFLDVRNDNPALKLYERVGFEKYQTNFAMRTKEISQREIEIRGLRKMDMFKDWEKLWELYLKVTPDKVLKILEAKKEDAKSKRFDSVIQRIGEEIGKHEIHKFVVEKNGRIVAKLQVACSKRDSPHQISITSNADSNLCKNLILKAFSIIAKYPKRLILSNCHDYEPEVKKALIDSGFEIFETFYGMYKILG